MNIDCDCQDTLYIHKLQVLQYFACMFFTYQIIDFYTGDDHNNTLIINSLI